MYKLIVFDCDGTLINDSNEILPKTRDAIQKAASKGIKIGLASGRAATGIKKVISELNVPGLFNYYICFNGACIYDVERDMFFDKKFLGKQDILFIYKYAKKNNAEFYYLTMDAVHSFGNVAEADSEADKNELHVEQIDFTSISDGVQVTKIVLSGSMEFLDKIQSKIPRKYQDKYNIARSALTNLEFLSKDVSKANSITKLCAQNDIPIESVMAFGDAENDLEMIKTVGCGIAMGNAMQKVQQAADIVTGTNNENGISDALESLLWNGLKE